FDAGLPSDAVQIKSISVSPDLPKIGAELTVTVDVEVMDTVEEGATADVLVKVGRIKLLQKTFDICEVAWNANATITCPVAPGTYSIVQTVQLPKEVPKIKYAVSVHGYTKDQLDMACVDLTVQWSARAFFGSGAPRRSSFCCVFVCFGVSSLLRSWPVLHERRDVRVEGRIVEAKGLLNDYSLFPLASAFTHARTIHAPTLVHRHRNIHLRITCLLSFLTDSDTSVVSPLSPALVLGLSSSRPAVQHEHDCSRASERYQAADFTLRTPGSPLE
ncbi:ML domain-containing protein, partial [Mycena sanguinolenta]